MSVVRDTPSITASQYLKGRTTVTGPLGSEMTGGQGVGRGREKRGTRKPSPAAWLPCTSSKRMYESTGAKGDAVPFF